jgi:hypothetical protein
MPVKIGAKSHNFTDPTGLLSDCHRRIEIFLGSLQAVAQVIDRPATEEVAQALESSLLYFSQAAPKHTADEEESLFPGCAGSRMLRLHRSFPSCTSWRRNIAGRIRCMQRWSGWG